MDDFRADGVSPEKDLIHKEKIRLIHESLLMLTDTSPSDAFLVKMHLEGLSYQQMAEKELGGQPSSDKQLIKRVNAIKKQFTRDMTGSLAKFKSCFERCLMKNKLNLADMMN